MVADIYDGMLGLSNLMGFKVDKLPIHYLRLMLGPYPEAKTTGPNHGKVWRKASFMEEEAYPWDESLFWLK